MRDRENLTAKKTQRWEAMAKERGAIGLAYEIRLAVQEVFRCPAARENRGKFKKRSTWVHVMREEIGELSEPTAGTARMIEALMNGILAHWKQGLTTAFMERPNSLFSAVKRKARGYRSVEYMITMLYLVAGKPSIPFD